MYIREICSRAPKCAQCVQSAQCPRPHTVQKIYKMRVSTNCAQLQTIHAVYNPWKVSLNDEQCLQTVHSVYQLFTVSVHCKCPQPLHTVYKLCTLPTQCIFLDFFLYYWPWPLVIIAGAARSGRHTGIMFQCTDCTNTQMTHKPSPALLAGIRLISSKKKALWLCSL